ncbi:MAG: signal peptidase I [Flavobacteriaceae bacterium]|nr:signal peptidase I [Flavobacteriaceae bacterium]
MAPTQWLFFILIVQVIHFIGTWKLYQRAGRKPWEAIIPIYNAIVLMQIINRPKWWVILLFIPIINLLMFPVIWVETIRSFGFNHRKDTLLAIFTFGLYIIYINYFTDEKYIENRSLIPRTETGEWISSIVFAIVAATIIHTYLMQPYTIPTSSLEKSLLVGDFLFVSKFHYGARTPMTTISMPMVHDTIPILKIPSYLKKPSLPYFRIPGFQKIKRNDIVVFSWPADTVRYFGDHSGIHIQKPIDKKSNYVKRCVGIPGDSLEVKDGHVYINGVLSQMPDRTKIQFFYIVDTNGQQLSERTIRERYHVREGTVKDGKYILNLAEEDAEKMKSNLLVKNITRYIEPKGSFDPKVFPHNQQYPWSVDNFGPIYIPQAGKTVALTLETLPFYQRIIEEYEHHQLKIEGDKILIDGKAVTSYTFQQDYYWMMGDNRHNSEDARFWGYVPFDHVVGKPVFIWFSWDSEAKGILNKIRWDRLFTTVHGDGKAVSYFKYFIAVMLLCYGYSVYSDRKKRNKK